MDLTNIYLARHGETNYNRKNQIQGRGIDASLNDTGRMQARAIAHYLRDVSIQRIFSSRLKRAQETAQVAADMLELEIETYSELDEMNFGVLEGRPVSEINTELQNLHQTWKAGDVEHAIEQGESPRTVFKRADGRMQHLIEKYSHSNLFFVLHGRLLRILLSVWLNYGLQQMHRIPHSNGALYHLQWNAGNVKPVYLNKNDHLVTVKKQRGVAS